MGGEKMRILAIFSLSLSAAVFAADYLLPVSALLPLALTFIILGAGLLLLRRRWLRGIELALFGLAAGLGVFLLKYNAITVPCHELDGETVTLHAYLTDYPEIYEDYCRAEIRITDRTLPRVNAILYVNDLSLTDAESGQVIETEAKLHSADMRYGREYDRYNAGDIFLTANAKTAVITDGKKLSVPVISAKIRKAVGSRIEKYYKPREAAFIKALTMGDKSALYKETELYNALSDAGLMHVAAVSGMHIAFLVSLLMFIFGRGRHGAVIAMIIVWAFVFCNRCFAISRESGLYAVASAARPCFQTGKRSAHLAFRCAGAGACKKSLCRGKSELTAFVWCNGGHNVLFGENIQRPHLRT